MASNDIETALPLSRPIPSNCRPECLTLHLSDGYETPVYVHSPATQQPRRLPVLYVHGIQSHPGWFTGSALALAEAGHPVFQVTRRGSGANLQDRGDAASADQMLGDVEAACRFVLSRAGSDRLDLLGVSWGGKLLAAYAANTRRAEELASLTLVAPGIVPQVRVPAATKIHIALALVLQPRKMFTIPLDDVELFTRNELMQAYLRGDRLSLHRATARFLYASRSLDRIVSRAPAGSLTVPTTLILGSDDLIIDNAATRRAVDRLTSQRVAVKDLAGSHTLEFESEPTSFYQALVEAVAIGEAKKQK